jgi:dienelactone hydrolase
MFVSGRVSAAAIVALSFSCLAPVAGAQQAPPAVFSVDAARTVMAEDSSLSGHTIYRPAKLPGEKMPVVVWGNSGCIKAGNSAAPFLGEIAAHGYLVIASGPIARLADTQRGVPPRIVNEAAASTPTGALPTPGQAPSAEELTKTSDLGDAISWADAQNKQKGSPFFGKIDIGHVAAMGTSCGGLQAIEIGGTDERVKSIMIWSSGLLDRPRAGTNVTEENLKAVRGPILYVSGASGDAAAAGASKKDFERVQTQPMVHVDYETGRQQLNAPNGGQSAPIAVAWLDWQFKGKKNAAKLFKGADCGLCSRPGYTVMKKNID